MSGSGAFGNLLIVLVSTVLEFCVLLDTVVLHGRVEHNVFRVEFPETVSV